MKTIIAGSRAIKDLMLVFHATKLCGWPITEVVSGCAPGVDTLGEQWAKDFGIPIKRFPAKWDDLTTPGAYIRCNIKGMPYNARAGLDRNEKMAEYAEALIAIWNGHSTGTAHMIEQATRRRLRIYKHKVTK